MGAMARAPKHDKQDVMEGIRRMRQQLVWHKKEDMDLRIALEIFDNIHKDKLLAFRDMTLPHDSNERRRMKLDFIEILKEAHELCLRDKLNMKWWIDSFCIIIREAAESQQARVQRRQTLAHRTSCRESTIELDKIRVFQQKNKLVRPSRIRGSFRRIKAYQSTHGVPQWPIGHRKGSSMVRVGLELHSMRDLQATSAVRKNPVLVSELDALYAKMWELWETLKARKLTRETRALIKHKCVQLNPAQMQSEFGSPWAVSEMLEMQQQKLHQNKQFNQIRNLRESVHINSARTRMGMEDCIDEMTNMQRIQDSMANDALQRDIQHEKASSIQRKSFERGMKQKQGLRFKQSQLETQLEYDDGTIDKLEKEISEMLFNVNMHEVNLDHEKLPKFEIFVPIKAETKAKFRPLAPPEPSQSKEDKVRISIGRQSGKLSRSPAHRALKRISEKITELKISELSA